MSLNICRITFCSNSGEEREITGQFEYMSYYLLLKLELLGHAASWFEYMSYYLLLKLERDQHEIDHSLNICRITFCSNSGSATTRQTKFEYMSYYLLLKLQSVNPRATSV